MRIRKWALLGLVAAVPACNENRSAADAGNTAQQDVKLGGVAEGRPGSRIEVSPSMVGGQTASRAPGPPVATTEPAMAGEEQLPSGTQAVAPSMVIRTGEARIEVSSVDSALVQLQRLAQRVGGYIGNSSRQAGEKELRQATVELKVPADRFSEAAEGLETIGEVEFVNVNVHDVGEEFVDITARVENARRLEQRLIGLLASRTGRLEEVLSVERELARVRETIERYEGRLRYLRTRVSVSTLSITVHEPEPLVGQLGSSNRIVDAFKNAWRNFVGFLAFFIESLGVLIPLGIIAFVIGRWVWKNRYRPPPPPAPRTTIE
jgi:hypothetical protein